MEIVIRCSFIKPTNGEECKNDAVYWVGRNEVDDYTYCCKDHLEEMKRKEDTVRKL